MHSKLFEKIYIEEDKIDFRGTTHHPKSQFGFRTKHATIEEAQSSSQHYKQISGKKK